MITRIDAVQADSNTANFGNPPSSKDIIFVWAYGIKAIPVPSDFTTIALFHVAPQSASCGYKISDGTETNTEIWTNAVTIQSVIYRGAKPDPGAVRLDTGRLNEVNIPALELEETSGESWILSFLGSINNTGSWSTPAGVLNLINGNMTSATYDSGTGLSSFSGGTVITQATSAASWTAISIEVRSHKPRSGLSPGGHWTLWECGTFCQIEETGAKFPCGADTLVTILNDAKTAGITVTIKKA